MLEIGIRSAIRHRPHMTSSRITILSPWMDSAKNPRNFLYYPLSRVIFTYEGARGVSGEFLRVGGGRGSQSILSLPTLSLCCVTAGGHLLAMS
jgi:hypothetical protein